MSVPVVYDAMLLLMRVARPDRIRPTFDLVASKQAKLFISPAILAEVGDVLIRPAYASRFPALRNPAGAVAFLAELLAMATLVADVPERYVLQRDPKDSKYINLALTVQAEFLVTRDRDLLDLMDVATPNGQEFLSRFPHLKIAEPGMFVEEMLKRANPIA